MRRRTQRDSDHRRIADAQPAQQSDPTDCTATTGRAACVKQRPLAVAARA